MAGAETWNDRLPVELLDMIFEDTDSKTQKACSLVCRDWLGVSRRHIFDTVVVRSDTSFDAFLQFLTTHPDIGDHVNELYLLGPDRKSKSYKADKFPLVDPVTLVDIAMAAPNVSSIKLEAVGFVDIPENAKAGLASLPGPVQLPKLSLTGSPLAVDHSPVAILRLSTCSRRSVQHHSICLKKITRSQESHLDALTHILVPGSLRQLHLEFYNWSHIDEMGRFLQHVGDSITEFTITFGHALSMYNFRDHTPSEKEWASYGFSNLRNLSKLRFDLQEPLTGDFDEEPPTWLDSTGISRFLACFPRDLPLHDGVDIDVQYVGDIVLGGYGFVKPRPKIEDALLRFENLTIVGLCPSSTYGGDYATDFGAQTFPRLWEANLLACMDDVDECCL
ncbi:hypothetical protein K466DRAFT_664104 [Polyporus arcularius HHB13444]|uniref:Uncharacterized protein n=1 Tax=Polyporus arcularius HHB13444 TaxID=1314778 RepID=A0A5C3P8I9_9APHY|nr:hypothetical protein K466DRAFT_664104 [Polyporus arcularius HHB13444]